MPPPGCTTNSPFVGDFPFSNIRTKRNSSADMPVVGVSAYSQWNQGTFQRADYSWMTFDFLVPTAEGRLYAYDSATNTAEAIDEGRQAFFAVSIYDYSVSPPTEEIIPLWIKDVTTSSPAPGFDAWKYTIAAKATPPSSDFPSVGSPSGLPPTTGLSPWSGIYHSICPASDDESSEALILQYSELKFDGDAAWLEDGFGLGPVNLEIPSTSVIACQGHAFSKPQEFLGITPNSYLDANNPGERSYGLDNYNAVANAYRAFYDGESRTVLGTPVHFKDLRHNPPWFDQTTSAYLPRPRSSAAISSSSSPSTTTSIRSATPSAPLAITPTPTSPPALIACTTRPAATPTSPAGAACPAAAPPRATGTTSAPSAPSSSSTSSRAAAAAPSLRLALPLVRARRCTCARRVLARIATVVPR
ncbi:hypothetical protein OV079_29055 [Nannocystis pusilla]|uniref:Uncharacterized protein n=1 Tax=Nannocystis pusilla TaxID=889268 RepID=A0A9X3ESK8_9BACT|nr:hypothetical protein [Nannocystis pusilla]MCY1009542.1 hypothetical protein [Nannocystis pusilla]